MPFPLAPVVAGGKPRHRVILERKVLEHLLCLREQRGDGLRGERVFDDEVAVCVPEVELGCGEAAFGGWRLFGGGGGGGEGAGGCHWFFGWFWTGWGNCCGFFVVLWLWGYETLRLVVLVSSNGVGWLAGKRWGGMSGVLD